MNKLTNKTILVTGGAGFIGSNLCDALIEANNKVTCLDNFLTGKRENIAHLLEHPNFTLVEGDLRNPEDCIKAVKGAEIVFHEGALGSVPRSINDPYTSTQINVMGTLNMLIAARDAGVKRFVYAASSSTYGDHPGLPKKEELIGKPLSPYAVSKYVNELHAVNFGELYGIETIGLRYFNVFGKRQDPEGAYAAVIPKFVKKLINGEEIVINGDGEHSRDFTYIENVIHANIQAATTTNPKAINSVCNVAYGGRTTLNELYDVLKELLSEFDLEIANMKSVHGPERKGDVKHSLASIEKAKELLGYDPQYDIRKGLKEAIAWYWENL